MSRERMWWSAVLVSLLPAAHGGTSVAAPVVIEGVPRTGWAAGHFTIAMDQLYAGLVGMGCQAGYEELMVASGAAFRTAWWPGFYSYQAPEMAPEDPITVGAQAMGGEAELIDHATPQDAWETVCRSIDAGAPCLVRNGCSWRVICGYDTQGGRMYKRDYNTSGQTPDVAPFEAPKPPWPETGGYQVIVLGYDANAGLPELHWREIVERAVRFADWSAEEKLYGTFVFGLGAYDAWAQTLRQGPDKSGAETDGQLLEFMARNMAEARASASVILGENAAVHAGFADAASVYMDEAQLFKDLIAALQQGAPAGANRGQLEQAMVRNIGNRDACEAMAQLVEQAKALDMQAIDGLRAALKNLPDQAPAETHAGPQTAPAPPATAPPATAPAAEADKAALAQQHLVKGRELKSARQFTEAKAELTQAIQADPKLAEAHYVLGWVLVELKDAKGAKAAFRKVIELVPEAEQATEAQKALDRLGP
jgi:tetratricopeptide (TPR) repeat protein